MFSSSDIFIGSGSSTALPVKPLIQLHKKRGSMCWHKLKLWMPYHSFKWTPNYVSFYGVPWCRYQGASWRWC